MTFLRASIWPLLPACVLLSTLLSAAGLADDPALPTEEQKTEAKAIFAAQCSWCHGNYGLTADKGPRLAGTQMTEQQIEERIRNGKTGYMPSFRRFLNDQQISLMAHYIKSLQPGS